MCVSIHYCHGTFRSKLSNVLMSSKEANKHMQMERKEDKGKCNNKEPVKSTMDMENTKNTNPKSSHQRTAVAGVMFRSLSFINLILHLLNLFHCICLSYSPFVETATFPPLSSSKTFLQEMKNFFFFKFSVFFLFRPYLMKLKMCIKTG